MPEMGQSGSEGGVALIPPSLPLSPECSPSCGLLSKGPVVRDRDELGDAHHWSALTPMALTMVLPMILCSAWFLCGSWEGPAVLCWRQGLVGSKTPARAGRTPNAGARFGR